MEKMVWRGKLPAGTGAGPATEIEAVRIERKIERFRRFGAKRGGGAYAAAN